MKLIAIDHEALTLIAQQLESRMIDHSVIAADLKRLIASAKSATSPQLVAEMLAEIKSYGYCRSALHKPKSMEGKTCTCRYCRIVRSFES